MIDLISTLQIVFQEAKYQTWLSSIDRLTAVGFEDDAIMGFACVFEDTQSLLNKWRPIETTVLTQYAPRLSQAADKAWNVYSVFVTASHANELQTRAVRQIEEDLERTRKIAASALTSHDDVILALLPVLPIQYRPRLDNEDYAVRLHRRIAAIAPSAADAALDETVAAADVVRLLGESP